MISICESVIKMSSYWSGVLVYFVGGSARPNAGVALLQGDIKGERERKRILHLVQI